MGDSAQKLLLASTDEMTLTLNWPIETLDEATVVMPKDTLPLPGLQKGHDHWKTSALIINTLTV